MREYCPNCDQNFESAPSVLKHLNNPRSSCIQWYDTFQELLISGDPAAEEYRIALEKALGQSPAHSTYQFPTQPDTDVEMPNADYSSDFTSAPQAVDGPGGAAVCKPRDEPEKFPHAAEPQGKGQTFMEWHNADEFARHRQDNIYYPWASKPEWELASFLLRSSLSMREIDDFLKLEMVRENLQYQDGQLKSIQICGRLTLSFSSAKELRARAELLPSGPRWKSQTIKYDGFPTKTPIILYYRDPLECVQFLLRNPLLKDHLDLVPKKTFRDGNRVIGEWITSDGAWEMQVSSL